MPVLRKVLIGLLVLALFYGALLSVEHLTTQELTRATNGQEAVCLMWRPQFLRDAGICYLDLLNAQGKVVDSAPLGTLDVAFDALQQFGQLGFDGQTATVANKQTGEIVRRFEVHDGHLKPLD